jgi:hypothetical protein
MATLEERLQVRRQSKVAFRSVQVGASDRDGCVGDVSQVTAYATSYPERRASGYVTGMPVRAHRGGWIPLYAASSCN